jgi:hypothetical protein
MWNFMYWWGIDAYLTALYYHAQHQLKQSAAPINAKPHWQLQQAPRRVMRSVNRNS